MNRGTGVCTSTCIRSYVMNNKLMASIAAQIPEGSGIKIPPNVFIEMDGEMMAYEPGKSLVVRFPVKEKYQNPFGFMQGGMVVAAVDNTIGPLSLLVAEPSVTTQLNTTYIRPIGADHEYITITATIVEKTRRNLHLQADVRNGAGKLCVKCFASCAVI